MISVALAALLLAPSSAPAQSREAYARCLKELVRTSSEKKMEAAAFEAALAAACRDKEALFKNAMISSEVGLGVKRAVAEKGIAEEIADYRSMAKEDYQATLASAPAP
jgi:hypothetical protein